MIRIDLPDIELTNSDLACTCKQSYDILEFGLNTCKRLFELAQDTTGDDKMMLLRSALIYGCSTLDSVGKRLTRDCLKELIDLDEAAQKTFEQHIAREIKRSPDRILAKALSRPDYRGELIKFSQESTEGVSLQSFSQISELTAKFGIPTNEVISESSAKEAFNARQQVIHELDIDPEQTGAQRERTEGELEGHIKTVLEAAAKLIQNTHAKIHAIPVVELSTEGER